MEGSLPAWIDQPTWKSSPEVAVYTEGVDHTEGTAQVQRESPKEEETVNMERGSGQGEG